ncbi:restriction endonuclease subunit S [Ekhidna sp.]|uniref:restriction endonuclease subunit S n=1 Tax=Ekhidna sp. TaxID=2608089 RepID=UPI003B5BB553
MEPSLRFSEFKGNWDEVKLGDIATFKKGKGISKSDIVSDGNVECIRYGELYTHYSEVINEIESRTNIKKGLVLSKKGDVIIPASGETQIDIATASCILKEGVVLGGDLNIIESTLNGIFLSYYLNNKRRYDIARLAQGNSVVHLYPSQLRTLKLVVPTIPEQQKIASFLSVVDTKIWQLQKKKDLLEQYKKGVMQKLFSLEIRFKQEDGNDFPEWEERKLDEFLTINQRPKEKPSKNYLALGIRSHGLGTFQKPDFDPENNSMDTLYEVREGDLIVNITFAWEGAIAIAKPEDTGGLVSHRFPTYKIDELITSSEYFKHIITGKRFRHFLGLISPGGAGRNRVLSKKDFLKLKWMLPSIDEQKKIIAFLGSIDTRIDAVEGQLEKAKTFKKGLLQQLFV